MTARRKVLVSWSTGKDSAFALHAARQDPALEVVGLLSVVTAEFERVSMHGVRRTLLARQAESLGLPCTEVAIPAPCPNEVYERAMAGAMAQAKRDGVEAVVFGDLFLEDVRRYREDKLAPTGLEPLVPLWGRDTRELARTMVASGLRAILTCVDPRQLDRSFAGRTFDAAFLAELPPTVDPCGEKGEFHTFACAGPMFRAPIAVRPGEVALRDGFVFADLLPS